MPNFALYFGGQLVSNTGAWFQNLALALIVLQLTGSASALAFVTVAQFGPILIFGGLAGRLADAVKPRTILIVTSLTAGTVTAALGFAVAGDEPVIALLYALIALNGTAQAFERIAAQAIIYELVGPSLLQNAVVLSTIYVSGARSIGPGLAGLAFLTIGPSACLFLNAASFGAIVLALLLIRPADLHPRPRPEGVRVSTLATIRGLGRNRPLVVLLAVNVIVTMFAMNMNVVLTAVVTLDFSGDAGELGLTHTLNAIGAIAGGLLLTRARSVRVPLLVPACLGFAFVLVVNAAVPTLLLFLVVAPVLGLGLGFYQGVLNSAAQVASPPHEIGRTMSLVTVGNYGFAPFGAVLIGVLIDLTTGQSAFVVGAAACILSAALVYFAVVRPARAPSAEAIG
ncbi:MAG TPA: MFS transporter [Terrimesophilobacter sp.]|nr:MFS transporter [Terrimesophilobacter sp.]